MAEGDDFVVIAGTPYPVQVTGARKSKAHVVGHKVRAHAGNILSTVRAEFWEWPMVIGPITQEEYEVLENDVALGAIVEVSGTFQPGDTIMATVEIVSEYTPDGLDYQRVVNVTIEQAE